MDEINEIQKTFRKLTLKCTRQPIRYQYNVTAGKMNIHKSDSHSIQTNSSVATSNSISPVVGPTACRDFFGTCFNCGCRAHSQNFCPLKECNVCKKWGHADRVCYHRRALTHGLVTTASVAIGPSEARQTPQNSQSSAINS